MTPSQLQVRKVSHRGNVSEWTLNPAWVRLEREVHEEFGIERLLLVSHGRKLPIAGFLSPDEKETFADALTAAIGEAKRGVTRSVDGLSGDVRKPGGSGDASRPRWEGRDGEPHAFARPLSPPATTLARL